MLGVLKRHRPFEPLFVFLLAISLVVDFDIFLLFLGAVAVFHLLIETEVNLSLLLSTSVHVLVLHILDLDLVIGLEGGGGRCNYFLLLV